VCKAIQFSIEVKKTFVENDQLGVFQNPGVPARRRNHCEDIGRFDRPTVRQAVSEQGLFLERRRPDIEICASMKSSKPGKARSNRRQRKRQETESGFSQREALERHAESGRTTNGSYASHYECSQPV
jgi:hypothetical protein